jgi:hypothetical protein
MTQDLEKTLWATADKLRNNMDAAEYKHIVLGLIFLKYISDSFEELHIKLTNDKLSDAEDKDEYLAENVFFVPPTARWEYLQFERAKLPTIGKDIDDAMDANPTIAYQYPSRVENGETPYWANGLFVYAALPGRAANLNRPFIIINSLFIILFCNK